VPSGEHLSPAGQQPSVPLRLEPPQAMAPSPQRFTSPGVLIGPASLEMGAGGMSNLLGPAQALSPSASGKPASRAAARETGCRETGCRETGCKDMGRTDIGCPAEPRGRRAARACRFGMFRLIATFERVPRRASLVVAQFREACRCQTRHPGACARCNTLFLCRGGRVLRRARHSLRRARQPSANVRETAGARPRSPERALGPGRRFSGCSGRTRSRRATCCSCPSCTRARRCSGPRAPRCRCPGSDSAPARHR
jgi:hypothetical protein